MNKFLTAATLLLIITFNLGAKAQISAEDQKATEKVCAAFQDGFKKWDYAGMSNLFTENGVLLSPEGEIVRGRAALRAHYLHLFAYFETQPIPDKTTCEDSNWQTRYVTPGIVLISYTSETTNYFGDKTRSDKLSYAALLVKKNNQWLAEQVTATRIPDTSGQ